jgi:hypothetical protein
MPADRVDRQAGEAMLRCLHEHVKGVEPVGRIADLIHPQARMRLLVSFGATLRGRQAVLEALQTGRQAALYHAEVRRFEWLDDHTVLTFGRARYALQQGGHAEGSVVWLDEFRHGLVWSVQVFMHEQGARRAYKQRRKQRGGREPPPTN